MLCRKQLEAAVAALREQGYETVQVMDVADPGDVRSVFAEDLRGAVIELGSTKS